MSLVIPIQKFAEYGNSLSYGIVPWDSEIFGFNVIEITNICINNIVSFDKFIYRFESHVKSFNGRVLCVKIPFESKEISWGLQRFGYTFVEETIKPYITDIQKHDNYSAFIRYPLKKVNDENIEMIRRIAYTAFKQDRFHMDQRFDYFKASERYSYWVNNSYKSGEDVLALDVDGSPAGFSIVNISGDKAYLGLIGLDEMHKGKGLGINLFAATCQYVKDRGVKEISTTASLNNISALNMYAMCGFRFRDPVYVLHKWLQ